jgi:hypothetical protein
MDFERTLREVSSGKTAISPVLGDPKSGFLVVLQAEVKS